MNETCTRKVNTFLRLVCLFFAVVSLVIRPDGPVCVEAETAAEEHPLEKDFREKLAGVERMIEDGRLEKSAGERAREISILLRKDLIENDARIQTLKLEAMEYDGERRQAAVDGLVKASEERSLIYTKRIADLDDLAAGVRAGTSPTEKTVSVPENASPAKKKTFSIEFKGEDLTTEPASLE